MIREISHPQWFVPFKPFQWMTPPSLGRVFVVLCYWAMIIYFMSWDVVRNDGTYWERIAYRHAWVTVSQLPMLYLLSMKFNIVGFIIGSSHERLNWLHRWVARTMFISATCHGFHFWTEWVRADFVAYELSIMPMVKYGLGAWAVLLLSVVVGFVPIRRMAYEVWLLQHIASAVVMLWLIYMHIPANARYMLWMAISFLVFDRAARWVNLLWQNTRFRPNRARCEAGRYFGHRVSVRAAGDAVTIVTAKDVHFKWSAGQHVYLWIPRLGPLEAHPYTIACAHAAHQECCCNSIQLIVRTHGGFSKRIHRFASDNPDAVLRGFVSGPYGSPPKWDAFETLVLIGASTGASFTVPILESVTRKLRQSTCVRRVEVAIIARTREETEYYAHRAKLAARVAQENGIEVRLHIAITGVFGGETTASLLENEYSSDRESLSGEKPTGIATDDPVDGIDIPTSGVEENEVESSLREYNERVDIENLIRDPVEAAWGETAVVVCGGQEIVARTRNCVSRLSDERAVHKGTGAQGIYLHVEEYSF